MTDSPAKHNYNDCSDSQKMHDPLEYPGLITIERKMTSRIRANQRRTEDYTSER